MTIIPHVGVDGWVEDAIYRIHECLIDDKPPVDENDCDYCAYREASATVLRDTK